MTLTGILLLGGYMTKEQFINFLKAPFSKSFIYAYVFALFALLIIPVLVDFGQMLGANFSQVSLFTSAELEQAVINYLNRNYDNPKLWQAVIGLVLASFLTTAYNMRLIYRTVNGNQDVLEAEALPLTISEILWTVPKMFGLWAAMVVTIVGICLIVGLGGMLLSTILSAIADLLGGIGLVAMAIGSFILMYKMWCYLMTFNLIFFKEWRIRTFFDYKRVRGVFLAHRMRVYALCVLLIIIGSIISNLISFFVFLIMQKAADVDISYSTMIPAGLVAIFIYVYLTLLQATIMGKLFLWAGKSE